MVEITVRRHSKTEQFFPSTCIGLSHLVRFTLRSINFRVSLHPTSHLSRSSMCFTMLRMRCHSLHTYSSYKHMLILFPTAAKTSTIPLPTLHAYRSLVAPLATSTTETLLQ